MAGLGRAGMAGEPDVPRGRCRCRAHRLTGCPGPQRCRENCCAPRSPAALTVSISMIASRHERAADHGQCRPRHVDPGAAPAAHDQRRSALFASGQPWGFFAAPPPPGSAGAPGDSAQECPNQSQSCPAPRPLGAHPDFRVPRSTGRVSTTEQGYECARSWRAPPSTPRFPRPLERPAPSGLIGGEQASSLTHAAAAKW